MNENPTNAQEQYELGKKYKEGDGVPKDLEKAIFWFIKAYEQGHPDGQFEFANAYNNMGRESYHYQPEWLPRSDVMDVRTIGDLLFNAANRGSIDAQYNLALRYFVKTYEIPPIDPDMEKAAYWFNEAAERGHIKAQIHIGDCYNLGNGVPKDLEKANFWYTKAAEQGSSEGQLKLGTNYYYGNGITQDLEKAKHWITLAAKNVNYTEAQKALENLNAGKPPKKNSSCYIATCVYGSYDCPEVWTLRRYRDNRLSASWFGRQFIRIYYTISPKLVDLFGDRKWFSKLWKPVLNKLVNKLQKSGVEGSPYSDI